MAGQAAGAAAAASSIHTQRRKAAAHRRSACMMAADTTAVVMMSLLLLSVALPTTAAASRPRIRNQAPHVGLPTKPSLVGVKRSLHQVDAERRVPAPAAANREGAAADARKCTLQHVGN